jgi:hypothetical protein
VKNCFAVPEEDYRYETQDYFRAQNKVTEGDPNISDYYNRN